MVTLENEYLKVAISSKGAEINSIIDKVDGTEYIWQGNPQFWPYHAPNLFPIVGGLKNNTLQVNNQKYTLNRHGFARTSNFRRIESAPQQAIFELRYDEETLKVYPYKFDFQVIYHLADRTLKTSYKVINMDEGTIFFSVGAHPAFNIPLAANDSFEDYYLEFNTSEELKTYKTVSSTGLFSGETVEVPTVENKIPLNRDLFKHDALVFKNIKSKEVTLKSTKHNKQVKVTYPHFEYLGIWTKDDFPFICIEPWLGCSDTEGELKDISQKEGIQSLKHGHVFETDYFITV